jgi:hypothetical protein
VEILNTIESHVSGLVVFVGLLLFCGAVFLAYIGIKQFIDDEHGSAIFCLALALVAFVFSIAMLAGSSTVRCYEVTISDSVSFNEFNEHYKIIEQDGKIFTVEEK